MADIFISYARADASLASEELERYLVSLDYDAWRDTCMHAGVPFREEIEKRIADAKAVIVIWSESARLSAFVKAEATLALQAKKLISTCLPGFNNLPIPFGEINHVQVTDRARIINSLKWLGVTPLDHSQQDRKPQARPVCKFVLTSTSSRRIDLLKQIGWEAGNEFITQEVGLPKARREITSSADAQERAQNNAAGKIRSPLLTDLDFYEQKGLDPNQTVLVGADTLIFWPGNNLDRPKILDKALEKDKSLWNPRDRCTGRDRAIAMLASQSGGEIQIMTGLAYRLASDRNPQNPKDLHTWVTKAIMKPYSPSDIEQYVEAYQPFDKAGGFGIQDGGVALFETIEGGYSNVVGLPLREFINSLKALCDRSQLSMPPFKSSLAQGSSLPARSKVLSAVCIGDINYDVVYDGLSEGFFASLKPPGRKVIGEIHRGAGGTAVQFAKGAKTAGFHKCAVIGVIGDDALGRKIDEELNDAEIDPILRIDRAAETGLVIILRDKNHNDTSVTVTDPAQALPNDVLEKTQDDIRAADVFYCSGYCLMDSRRKTAKDMMSLAKSAGSLVVLDAVVNMHENERFGTYFDLLHTLPDKDEVSGKHIDVFVSEIPEILTWLGQPVPTGADELEAWEFNKNLIVGHLRRDFSLSILRTSNYAHEIIVTPDNAPEPVGTNYATEINKVGYGDKKTAEIIYSYLSPRIVIASKSPQRYRLLTQIVAENKIQRCAPPTSLEGAQNEDERFIPGESPYQRVERLARKKAIDVFHCRDLGETIEFVIGADTEIFLNNTIKGYEFVGHPKSAEEARACLKTLSGREHYALTGIAVIGEDPVTQELKIESASVETTVRFADLTESEIEQYVESGEPIGRAGGYAIQGLGELFVKRIVGSYSNVVGLPLERLSDILKNTFNRPIWTFDRVSKWCPPKKIKGRPLIS
jgi:septum formation protein